MPRGLNMLVTGYHDRIDLYKLYLQRKGVYSSFNLICFVCLVKTDMQWKIGYNAIK